MKKTIILSILSISLLICVFTYVTFRKDIDQFNPFYKQEYVYASVNKPATTEGKYIRYRYHLTGYNAQGQDKKITFSSSTELEPGSYVKVLAKGAYTKEWTKIKKDEIPDQLRLD